MDIAPGSRVRVIVDYQAPYADPIAAEQGDEVTIDSSRTTEWQGWVWCTNRAGKSGWVPETYLERHGDTSTMRCDYNAIELTIKVGEILTCHKSESGFLWVTNQEGQNGWVPSTHVELMIAMNS